MTDRQLEFHQFYINVAQHAALLSRCERKKVGAIIVKDGNILSYGFNGTPSGFCNDCEDEDGNTKVEVLHAESNALMKCLSNGASTVGASMYVTMSPCVQCVKLIIQSGITKVYYTELYRNTDGLDLLHKAGVELIDVSDYVK